MLRSYAPSRCLGSVAALLAFLFFASPGRTAPTDVPAAASFYVSRLPDLHQDEANPLRIFAGPISSDPNITNAAPTDVTAHLYFVMVKARRSADKERLMFWFNGGPGCSSFDGLMMEVGPWRVDGQGGLRTVEGGWEEYTTMVYVDQPPGTGFSYTSTNHYVQTLSEASEHIMQFLHNFYDIFPEYRTVDTYLGGESFAGQYIPYFADAILNSTLNIPLRGAAIGNGWIDGRSQYASYLPYAVKHGLVEENSEDWKRGKKATDQCMEKYKQIQGQDPVKVDSCEQVMGEVVAGRDRVVDDKQKCTNIYDVRLEDDAPACGMNWPPDLKDVYAYLDRKDVVRALHATDAPTSWVECRSRVGQSMRGSDAPSAHLILPRVLERIPVMLFAGDQDLICNYMGIESLIQALKWNGGTGLGTVQTQSWTVDGSPAGTWVSSRNLTYVKIFNASHMAPFDLPHVTHDMILRFMGVNFSAITDGSVGIPSTVGGDTKPLPVLDDASTSTPVPPKSAEQDKAMWEAYYNAGSAALVLVIILVLIGGFLWWRSWRQRRLRNSELPVAAEGEDIPLASSMAQDGNGLGDDDDAYSRSKGKARAQSLAPQETIFGVGSDDEDDANRTQKSY